VSSKLTDVIRESIAGHVRQGTFPSVAARAVGISSRTYGRWMTQGAGDDAAGRATAYAEFFREVDQAHAEAEIGALRRMRKAEDKDVQFRKESWWLERWDRERWGRRVEIQVRDAIAAELLDIIRQRLEPPVFQQVESAILVECGEVEEAAVN